MRIYLAVSLKLVMLATASLVLLFLSTAWAVSPHNDTRDNSVEPVVMFHQQSEADSSELNYLSWTPVELLDNGHYKVTVRFRLKNRFGRSVLKKQIVIMDDQGKILKVMDCR